MNICRIAIIIFLRTVRHFGNKERTSKLAYLLHDDCSMISFHNVAYRSWLCRVSIRGIRINLTQSTKDGFQIGSIRCFFTDSHKYIQNGAKFLEETFNICLFKIISSQKLDIIILSYHCVIQLQARDLGWKLTYLKVRLNLEL